MNQVVSENREMLGWLPNLVEIQRKKPAGKLAKREDFTYKS